MKKLLLLMLAAPLAGCAQRAEMASSDQPAPAPGPYTLRYKLADQSSSEYQIRIVGDTTAGLTSQASDPPRHGLLTPTPSRTVQAKFQTQMLVRQQSAASLPPVSESASGSTLADEAAITPHATAGGSGDTTSMNEDRAPGDERPTVTKDLTTEGTWPSPPEAASVSELANQREVAIQPEHFELRQEVTNWTAQIDLPKSQFPNRLNGTFQDGQIAIEAQGAEFDLPQRYQEQIRQTLSRPVVATVTPTGKVLDVVWPVPEPSASAASGIKMERSADGLRAMTGSTETLNLWFGVIRLPDEAVNVGHTWDARDRFPVRAGLDGPSLYMEREAKYTLNNVTQTADGPVAEIALNETLKLIRGELPADTSAALGTGATIMSDSVTPTTGATTQPDLLETRMGKVYFNLNRGTIDRSQQHVSVTWAMNVGAAALETTGVVSRGQLQGTIHLDRLGTPTAAAAPTLPSSDTIPSGANETLPSKDSPDNAPVDSKIPNRVPGP